MEKKKSGKAKKKVIRRVNRKNMFNYIPDTILSHILGYIVFIPKLKDKRVWVCKRFSKCVITTPNLLFNNVSVKRRRTFIKMINLMGVKRVEMVDCVRVQMKLFDGMKMLEELKISGCANVTETMMETICGIKNLRSLCFCGCDWIATSWIKKLSTCSKLERFTLHNWVSGEITGSVFGGFKKLRYLDINTNLDMSIDCSIYQLVNLETLRMNFNRDLNIGNLINLRELELGCNSTVIKSKVSGINKIVNLETIKLYNCNLVLEGVNLNLRELDLRGCELGIREWMMISQCINLETIKIYRCVGLTEDIIRMLTSGLANLKKFVF